jgi:type IV secretion system protein VirB4
MLSVLDDVSVAYRFSTRFMPLDVTDALGERSRYRRKGTQLKRGFWSQIFRTRGGPVKEDAVLMAQETECALSDASSALVTFGYYTPVIVLMGEDRARLADQARMIARQIRALGFACRVETINTMEAWLGSLPGHAVPNVRRPLIHSLNLADLAPLSAKWPGRDANPSPLYPENSPPLMHAATGGATPFRLNLHVSDVGHTLIFGPTGAGKSVLLAMIAAQFRRYGQARITVFDNGRSIYALATACGAAHYDLAVMRPRRASPHWPPSMRTPMRPGPRTGSQLPMNCRPARIPRPGRSRKSIAPSGFCARPKPAAERSPIFWRPCRTPRSGQRLPPTRSMARLAGCSMRARTSWRRTPSPSSRSTS